MNFYCIFSTIFVFFCTIFVRFFVLFLYYFCTILCKKFYLNRNLNTKLYIKLKYHFYLFKKKIFFTSLLSRTFFSISTIKAQIKKIDFSEIIKKRKKHSSNYSVEGQLKQQNKSRHCIYTAQYLLAN